MRKKKDIIQNKNEIDGEIKLDIGRKIKEIRGKLNLSAKTVADKLDLSREAITQIETGRNNVSAVLLWKLATLFNCNINDFFPEVPNGFSITKIDLLKLEQEHPNAGAWAEKLFKKNK